MADARHSRATPKAGSPARIPPPRPGSMDTEPGARGECGVRTYIAVVPVGFGAFALCCTRRLDSLSLSLPFLSFRSFPPDIPSIDIKPTEMHSDTRPSTVDEKDGLGFASRPDSADSSQHKAVCPYVPPPAPSLPY